MTFKEAYEQWQEAGRNKTLAVRSRDAVRKVLMKEHADRDLKEFTRAEVRRIFKESQEAQEFKTKAASLLVWVLSWGGDHGYCPRPTFDYTIANEAVQTTPTPPTQEGKGDTPSAREEQPKKRKGGWPPRPVAQIDPQTMQVVKVWPDHHSACRELGARNLGRCVAEMRSSVGFYWCEPDDAPQFAERLKAHLAERPRRLDRQRPYAALPEQPTEKQPAQAATGHSPVQTTPAPPISGGERDTAEPQNGAQKVTVSPPKVGGEPAGRGGLSGRTSEPQGNAPCSTLNAQSETLRLALELADNGVILRRPDCPDVVTLAKYGDRPTPNGDRDLTEAYREIGAAVFDWLLEVVLPQGEGDLTVTGFALDLTARCTGRRE